MNSLASRWLAALALTTAGLVPVLAGCPGTLDDPSRFQVTCDPLTMTCGSTTSTQPGGVTTQMVQDRYFRAACYQCHSAAVKLGDLDLSGTPAMLEGRIVEAISATPDCRGKKLLVPGEPDRSLMFVKLVSTPTCGASMPFGGTAAAGDAALVRQWIIDLGTP